MWAGGHAGIRTHKRSGIGHGTSRHAGIGTGRHAGIRTGGDQGQRACRNRDRRSSGHQDQKALVVKRAPAPAGIGTGGHLEMSREQGPVTGRSAYSQVAPYPCGGSLTGCGGVDRVR